MQHQNRSPENIRIENRQTKNKEIWESPEWKVSKTEFLKKNPNCHWCGVQSVVPHHPDMEVYGKPEYLDLSGTVALCNICHGGTHAGKFQCPVCHKLRSKSEGERCYSCLDDSDKRGIRNHKTEQNQKRNEIARKKSRKYRPIKVISKQTGEWVTISRK